MSAIPKILAPVSDGQADAKPEAIGVDTTMMVAFTCSAGPFLGALRPWRLAPQHR
jgi:hypothetical protein